MNQNILVRGLVAVIVAGALGAAWVGRDSSLLRTVAARLGVPPADATPDTAATLAAAGVHKCRVGARTVYSDQACPAGSRELAANGGTVTVMSFPKPSLAQAVAPTVAAIAASVASAPLIPRMSHDEIDQARDRMIRQAGDR